MAKFEAGMEAMADMYVFETTSLLEQLDQILMKTENESSFAEEDINEIFRTMHTIKGSSAMMGLENMSKLAHAIEDMFYIIREDHPVITSMETLYDIIFSASDLLKAEIENLQEDEYTPTDFTEQMNKIEDFAAVLKGAPPASAEAAAPAEAAPAAPAAEPAGAAAPAPAAAPAQPVSASGLTTVKVFFEDDCKMENLRALLVINRISESCAELEYIPEDIENNGDTAQTIIKDGFLVKFRPAPGASTDSIMETIRTTANVKNCEVIERGSEAAAGDPSGNVTTVRVHFDDDCKMENLRALLVVNNVRDVCEDVTFEPADIEDNADTSKIIVEEGFVVRFKSDKPQMVLQVIEGTPSVKSYVVEEAPAPAAPAPAPAAAPA
ncbi:MAG: Hpt domain-containing protein, partial [Oscillospiraceae bacterium]|nr:Hpt domain-containing protein [Oscillospiraceae bacterium]